MAQLPLLISEDLIPTRDYLRNVALAMGSLQRGFLEPNPHDWQHGLEVTMRGLTTQDFKVRDEEVIVLLDFVRGKVRLDGTNWKLDEYSGAEIYNNFKSWLEAKKALIPLDDPEFLGGKYDANQAKRYSEALWWVQQQFTEITEEINHGSVSPILLYPHHFDLAFSWFPHDDKRQISVGFSTGDETVKEPYVYLTIYPEPSDLVTLLEERLPNEAYWQKDGFSGAVLPYAELQKSDQPQVLLRSFVGQTLAYSVAYHF